MHRCTEDDDVRFALAFALRRIRPLLRRIVLETHPDEHTYPANVAADKIIEHLRMSRYRVRRDRDGR